MADIENASPGERQQPPQGGHHELNARRHDRRAEELEARSETLEDPALAADLKAVARAERFAASWHRDHPDASDSEQQAKRDSSTPPM